MVLIYRTLPQSHLAMFRPERSLDHATLQAMLEPLGFENELEGQWNRLLDFTQVTEFDLDYPGLTAISSALDRADRFDPRQEPRFRVAILCLDSFAFGLARMIASVLERNGIEIRPFRNLRELSSWFQIPRETLQGC